MDRYDYDEYEDMDTYEQVYDNSRPISEDKPLEYDLEENDLLYKDLTENARSLIDMEFNCLAFGKKLLGIIRS